VTCAQVSTTSKAGLYNPYTMSGDIVVNGVLASCHSDWVLDRVLPGRYAHLLPAICQVRSRRPNTVHCHNSLPAGGQGLCACTSSGKHTGSGGLQCMVCRDEQTLALLSSTRND
jgi:Hint module